MTHFIVLWKIEAQDEVAFEADVFAKTAEQAQKKFTKMFPKDTVVSVKAR